MKQLLGGSGAEKQPFAPRTTFYLQNFIVNCILRTILGKASFCGEAVPADRRHLTKLPTAAKAALLPIGAFIIDTNSCPPGRGLQGITMMAKERKRGNREAKKPKQAPKPAAAPPAVFAKGLSSDIGKSKKT
jgi:hypothetical protein